MNLSSFLLPSFKIKDLFSPKMLDAFERLIQIVDMALEAQTYLVSHKLLPFGVRESS